MAMEEFDDEHPLNEASLVPDFPQNGYPMPLKLKLTPKSKRYSMPTVANVEIQTERSYTSHEQMSDRNPGSFGGPPKPFHGSNRSLATQKDFESPEYSSADHISSVTTNNKTFQQRLLNNMNNTPTKEFPTEPQYLPWPWRTANRAMRSKPASVKSGNTSFKSRNAELPDLGEFTIHNYGIKYDDTMSTANTHPPPRRPLSRASSVYNLSRPPTRMLEMKKSYSQEHLNRSKTSIGHFQKHPSSKSLLDRSVSHNDVSRSKPIIKPFQKSKFFEKPPSKPNNPSRRASVATIKMMMQRSNTRMLNTISESKERIPSPLRYKRKPPLPPYMRPLTRSKTLPTPSALKKAANVYGTRPATGKLKENARSMLQTKLRHKNMEQPVRRKKKYSKKKSSWKSPFSLPSSLQTRTLSLKTLSKMKHSKVEPAKSSTTIGRFNDSFTSRDFATTDHDVTSDSNGENFMEAEISHLPAIDHKPRLVSAAPRRENTYRMDKKVSEDSGISADESPTGKVAGNDDDMMFRVQEVIDKGKFKVVTPRSFPGPKKKEIPFHLPDYLK
ncbi:uncharacterized protein [Mytilus edulis]|uniref:uncharacterized protein isoform X1 n=1 Tax=Mytilus edulis TaxID=6550 RepID=UPI0039EED1D3